MLEPAAELTRRQFLHAGLIASTAFSTSLYAAGSDAIKVGVIGCGGRGTGAANQCANADPAVEITALGDAFTDQLQRCRGTLQNALKSRFQAPDDRCFVGLDAYRRVIDSGVDVVLLAAPTGFRPIHLELAIEGGKHVFAEKSGAVDGPGVRKLLEVATTAKRKSLSIVCGTNRRYQSSYLETIQRVHDGAIGDLKEARCSWLNSSMWEKDRQPTWSDTEYQIRSWFYYTWLSGDWPTEMLVHNLDAMNWVIQNHPIKVSGIGERRKYNAPKYGNILDHFVLTYTYPDDLIVHAECGLAGPGQSSSVSETVVGTKGTCDLSGKIDADGNSWRYSQPRNDPYIEEHRILIQSIRSGKAFNNLTDLAHSSLSGIMGRMAAYTGDEVTWDQALNSSEVLMPRNLTMGPLAVAAVPNPKSKNSVKPRVTTGEKYALLVGVRNYDKNELKNLKYSEPDITEMAQVLLKSGYRPENVVLMTQTTGAEDDRFLPRAAEIRRELRLLLKGLSENDSVIIGFAGHGVQFKNETEVYFCPAGTRLADRETLVSLTEVYAELEKCPAHFKLLISDACRNDPLTSNARSLDMVKLESLTRPQKKTPPGGVAALFSCSSGELAFEHEQLKHGVFYHFLIKGLQGDADTDGDGIVTLPELEGYLKKRVFDFVRSEYGKEQTPDFVGRTKGLVPLVELKK